MPENSVSNVHDKYWFASDNVAGVCPEAQASLVEAMSVVDAPYGEDRITAAARARLRDLFETDCAVYFVFSGTAANALALCAMCQSYHTVIVHAHAHVYTDECNAPEFFRQGLKLQPVEGDRARLTLDAVAPWLDRASDVHFSPVGALSLTQMTELGGLYTAAEIRDLSDAAHRAGAYVHMDGARFANAVAECSDLRCTEAALTVAPADLSWRAGVDILCFGGTKQGMPATEAILIFNPQLAEHFAYRVKQSGQLASKMRILAAPWLGMLADGAWLRHARHANRLARQLAAALEPFPALRVLKPVQGNAVFVEMPDPVAEFLHAAGWHFYRFTDRYYRLMCSWATAQEHIDAFVRDVEAAALSMRAGDKVKG